MSAVAATSAPWLPVYAVIATGSVLGTGSTPGTGSVPPTGSVTPTASVPATFVVVIDPGHQGIADNRLEPIGAGSKVKKPAVAGRHAGLSDAYA